MMSFSWGKTSSRNSGSASWKQATSGLAQVRAPPAGAARAIFVEVVEVDQPAEDVGQEPFVLVAPLGEFDQPGRFFLAGREVGTPRLGRLHRALLFAP